MNTDKQIKKRKQIEEKIKNLNHEQELMIEKHQKERVKFEETVKLDRSKITKDRKNLEKNSRKPLEPPSGPINKKDKLELEEVKKEIDKLKEGLISKEKKFVSELKKQQQVFQDTIEENERLRQDLEGGANNENNKVAKKSDNIAVNSNSEEANSSSKGKTGKAQVSSDKKNSLQNSDEKEFKPEKYLNEKDKQSVKKEISLIKQIYDFNGKPINLGNLLEKYKERDFCFDSNSYYKSYLKMRDDEENVASQEVADDGKIQRTYKNGKKEILFNNGVIKEIFSDGYVIVHFGNKDIKQTFPDQTSIYYFHEAKTSQVTFVNGIQLYRFSTGQLEIHHPSGRREIKFTDNTEKYINENGEEETLFVDGTVQKVDNNRIKTIIYTNGQTDVITPDGVKTRHYPNGKIRKILPGSYDE